MTQLTTRDRLVGEIRRLEDTQLALFDRLERTLTALALTLDAQAATQQRLQGFGFNGDRPTFTVAELEAQAERYRQLVRDLSLDGPSKGWARGDLNPHVR